MPRTAACAATKSSGRVGGAERADVLVHQQIEGLLNHGCLLLRTGAACCCAPAAEDAGSWARAATEAGLAAGGAVRPATPAPPTALKRVAWRRGKPSAVADRRPSEN